MSSAGILTGCWKKLTARGIAETERRQTAVRTRCSAAIPFLLRAPRQPYARQL